MKLRSLAVTLSLVGVGAAFVPATAPRAATAAASSRRAPRLALSAAEPAPAAEASLESEFAAVNDAALCRTLLEEEFSSLAPPIGKVERKRKRDLPVRALRKARTLVGFGKAVQEAASELVEDTCDIDEPEVCEDEGAMKAAVGAVSSLIGGTLKSALGGGSDADDEPDGDDMEAGWQQRGSGSALRRTLEVWKFLAKCGIKVLKAGKTKGGDEAVSAAKTAAAEFIRDGLFRLGPTFVKLGQVISTRTDVLEAEYIEVLKDLQDNVPGFGGDKAVGIIEAELGKPIGDVFDSFERTPIAAASLGQVHRAVYKGKPVAVKVQRAGLKELFDTDLKNLKVLVKLLDKFDPKSDGADRSYTDIYAESSKLLYEEIDYVREGRNGARFKEEFAKIGFDNVRVPTVFWEVTNERVLTMDFIESFKLTDIARVEAEGLDKKQLAQLTANSFLAQILKTGYFHCDPHPGNLCVDKAGSLVFYDCGMMNELSPSVAAGFKEACFAVFGGGPFISDIELDRAGKRLVDALELMGVLAKGADRLAVEKLARYFIRTFKDIQIGKAAPNIKTTLGADLQALTEQQVFRFPSTFTFIFRAFASVDGIGKGLDKDFDIPKLAQPFINELTEVDQGSDFEKWAGRLGKATGINAADIDTAIRQPEKVAYLEQTVRAMEQGNLKIRVRSLENEQALARLTLSSAITNKLLLSGLLLNVGLAGATALPAAAFYAASAAIGAQAVGTGLAIKIFDKKAARYVDKDFGDAATEAEAALGDGAEGKAEGK